MDSRAVFPDHLIRDYDLFPLLGEEELGRRVRQMSEHISHDYKDKNPILLCVLKGAYVFCSDLSRAMTIPHEMEFVKLSSYQGQQSSGEVKEHLLPHLSADRPVIIVEDIADTGTTIKYLAERLRELGVQDLRVATLLRKPDQYKVEEEIAYVGFDIANRFVVGYGLDYMGYGRGLRAVYEMIDKNLGR